MIRLTLAAIFAVVCFSPPAEAGNVHARQFVSTQQVLAANQIVVPTGFVVTQFAVPVAVPVAPVSYVQYTSSCCTVAMPGQYAQQPAQPAPQPAPVAQQPTPAPVQSSPQPQPVPQAQPTAVQPQPEPVKEQAASPLVKKYCATCHSGDQAKGGLVLDGNSKIDAEKFRLSVDRLLSDDPEHRMPKGTIVSPDELGLLIQQLANMK